MYFLLVLQVFLQSLKVLQSSIHLIPQPTPGHFFGLFFGIFRFTGVVWFTEKLVSEKTVFIEFKKVSVYYFILFKVYLKVNIFKHTYHYSNYD